MQIDREKEIRILYEWWDKERPDEWVKKDELLYKNKSRGWWEKEQELHKKDEEMLIRLMKIRRCLWT